ncbi:Uncharacterized protein HZ326_29190 [Fusarium oxysporum f. sp. albedinis]|nr:Uncharacterized protein HZ326_29190 [Fusarium oxysporum f. sp. albedinis]
MSPIVRFDTTINDANRDGPVVEQIRRLICPKKGVVVSPLPLVTVISTPRKYRIRRFRDQSTPSQNARYFLALLSSFSLVEDGQLGPLAPLFSVPDQ